jgi:hypothetical protein
MHRATTCGHILQHEAADRAKVLGKFSLSAKSLDLKDDVEEGNNAVGSLIAPSSSNGDVRFNNKVYSSWKSALTVHHCCYQGCV